MLSNKKKKFLKVNKNNKYNYEKIENLPLLSENYALDLVLHKSKLDLQNREKAKKIYQVIKDNIPEKLRGIINFRYRNNMSYYDIAANIQNYRIFLFPSENKDQIQLIYPKDDLNNLLDILPEKRKSELSNSWEFKNFPCYCFNLYFDEILSFHEIHWKSFSKACKMSNEAKKTRSRSKNIKVAWGKL